MSGNEAWTRTVALDCEMVGTGPKGCYSMAARVSIVDEYFNCLYDTYVIPTKRVTDYRTRVSGIKPHHLETGQPLAEVKKVVASTLRGAILVGHDVGKDLYVLGLSHPSWKIRDTAYYTPLRQHQGCRPSLKHLAAKYAGMKIQDGCHCSVTDAIATMKVYKKFEDEWEKWVDKHKSAAARKKKSKPENDSLWQGDFYYTDFKPKTYIDNDFDSDGLYEY